MSEFDIEHIKIATATPRSNSQVERANRFLPKTYLRFRSVLAKLSADGLWYDLLPKAQFVLNNTYYRSIDTSCSLLLLGCEQRRLIDLRNYKNVPIHP